MTGRNAPTALERILAEAGGTRAPRERHAQLRTALRDALAHGAAELGRPRSGYGRPVELAFAEDGEHGLLAALPAPPALRSDPAAAPERGWRVVASAVAALAEGASLPVPGRPEDLRLTAGEHDGFLLLALPSGAGGERPDAELAALAAEERLRPLDRLRVRAHALPPGLLRPADLRAPGTPSLRAAEAVARLGADPADPGAAEAFEDVLAVLLPSASAPVSAHDDPDPSCRAARRILRRLDGMGKWGGYHTAFEHLYRGFAGNERELASAVGEALLDAGLLQEKPSVGQRHVFLNPRRAGDIRRLIETGASPPELRLP